MHILVLGESGFIGRNLIAYIEINRIVGHDWKLLNASDCQNLSRVDVIINLCSRRSSTEIRYKSHEIFQSIFEYPKSVIESLADSNTLVINFSSYAELSVVAENIDLDAYAFSKKSFSHWLEKQNERKAFRLVDIMLFTIYGRFDKRNHLIPTLFENMNSRKQPRLSDGFQLINLLHIEDLLASITRVLESSNIECGRYSLWNPEFMTLRDLVSTFEKMVGMDLNPLWYSVSRKGHELDFEVFPPYPRLSFAVNPKTISSGLETLWNEYLSNGNLFT